ncbi:MAG: class I SAM-dependent RNA methyltransferase [Pseudomonadota bacterium]
MVEPSDIVVSKLGAKGDGVASADGDQIFIPFALPGETWRQGEGWERLSDSPDRIEPVCPHFGVCGGCIAQHMSAALYHDWKLDSVRQAFNHQGLDVEPVLSEAFPVSSRRRCSLTAKKTRTGVVLGYLAARSHTIVELAACPILISDISSKLDVLRELSAILVAPNGTLRIDVLSASNGLDVALHGDHLPLGPELRVRLAHLVSEAGIARLMAGGHEIAQLRTPIVNCSGVEVAVHPNAFLQAVEAAEAELASLVVQHVGRAKAVGDLFCGIGTFAFALARKAKVLALDSDRASIETLMAARDRAQKLKPIDARVRDLFREPLSRKELEGLDCVVFDPPRAGAEGQARMIAKSQVPRVVAVSCNPATLARDVRHLVEGGYQLEALHTVDQFRFSAHVECVAALSRPKARRR